MDCTGMRHDIDFAPGSYASSSHLLLPTNTTWTSRTPGTNPSYRDSMRDHGHSGKSGAVRTNVAATIRYTCGTAQAPAPYLSSRVGYTCKPFLVHDYFFPLTEFPQNPSFAPESPRFRLSAGNEAYRPGSFGILIKQRTFLQLL
jgi:hypothetical protein